jgi:hypothetical protein
MTERPQRRGHGWILCNLFLSSLVPVRQSPLRSTRHVIGFFYLTLHFKPFSRFRAAGSAYVSTIKFLVGLPLLIHPNVLMSILFNQNTGMS